MRAFSKDSKVVRIKKVLIVAICAVIAIIFATLYGGRSSNARLTGLDQAQTTTQTLSLTQNQINDASMIATGDSTISEASSASKAADRIAITYKNFIEFVTILLALLAYDMIKSIAGALSFLTNLLLRKLDGRVNKVIGENAASSKDSK